jgi:hypothetical protein
MEAGIIAKAARRDARSFMIASATLVVVLASVLGVNWKYLYNFAAGPFRFDAQIAASPGAREFVTVEGTTMPSGLVQETTLRLLRGVVSTTAVSAHYLVMRVDGRPLIVKVASDFSGRLVRGRLVPLPEAVRGGIPLDSLYPWLVDAETAYRWDFNLFVMIAAPLFPLSLLMLGYALYLSGSIERHVAFVGLQHLGSVPEVIRKVERELASPSRVGRAGPFSITPSWMVMIEPTLRLYPVQDVMGIGRETTSSKSRGQVTVQHHLRVWLRGKLLSQTIPVSDAEAKAVVDAVTTRWPWLVVEDAAGFERRWRSERDACEREVDAERKARASADAAKGAPTALRA